MPRITISYRRDDSLDITGRIFDRLTGHFGREAIFRDIDNIPPGADFRRHIDRVLDESDIALRKKKPLIPVLVSHAVMPDPDALPDSLHDFAYRNAVQIDSGQDFDVHVGRLIRGMERILRLGEKPEADEAGQGVEVAPRIEPTPTVASPVDPVAPVGWPFWANGGHTARLAIGLTLVVVLGVIGAGGGWWVFVERPAEMRQEAAAAEKGRV